MTDVRGQQQEALTDVRGQAEEALRVAAVDPAAAVALASAASVPARRKRAWEILSLAERALGVAAMQQSRLDDAITHLRTAVSLGRRSGVASCAGEARMSLASALLLRGRPAQSFRQIDQAVDELKGVAAARARTQRAAILQEHGRLEAALEDLRRALPVLRRSGDVQWATRALSNRGLLRISRREFAAAHGDLLAAQELCREHGLTLPGAIVEHNMAWLESQRGQVPAALQHLSAAEEMFDALGMATGSILTDRAELLLSVRLLDEALRTARAAIAADSSSGRENHLPESLLLLSTILLVAGDHQESLEAAERALDGFVRLGRQEWVALARHARIQALAATGAQVGAAECRRTADALEAAGWPVPALEALLLAGTIELAQGRKAQARRDLERAGRARRIGSADARARAWLAEALLREADGRPASASSALRAGLRVLHDHRATMGATELRAHVTLHRGAIARTGLRLAIEAGDARRALWWAESGRATSALLRRVTPPSDPELAALLAELRSVMTRISDGHDDGRPARGLVQRQLSLERQIKEHCRQFPGDDDPAAARPVAVHDLQQALGDASLVEFVVTAHRLLAVVVTSRRVRLIELGSPEPLATELQRATFALRRLAAVGRNPARVAAATSTLVQTGRRLDDRLLAPLQSALGSGPLVLVPDGALQGVPWSVLPSCAGRPVSVSPSATLWHAASRSAPRTSQVVAVAGPDLRGAQAEVGAVARRHPGSVVHVGESATAAAVLAAMDGARLAHLSAHGVIRSDNPMFSSLLLADGPLTVYDLERLGNAPHQVVLAACDTGHSEVVADGEILGFTAALMNGGTATLIAPVVPVADAETVPLMEGYHDALLAGRGPAEALSVAQQAAQDEGPLAMAAAAGFVCLGYGEGP